MFISDNTNTFFPVGFQVLTAENMMMTVFWDVAPYILVEIDQRFRVSDDEGSKQL
jgi:hypothetical protein